MRTFFRIALFVLLNTSAHAEMRTWTKASGETCEGEYNRMIFDDVVIKDAEGKEIRFALSEMSDVDRKYVELANPPKLSVDFRQSFDQDHIKESPFLAKPPPSVLYYQFGARVKQMDVKAYGHELTAEVFAFTQQRYDMDKYHLITRITCEPFVLNDANKFRYEFMDANKFMVLKYELDASYIGWTEKRGEKFAESLVLVRDERGEIIAYNTTKNWLYNHLDQLEKLPVGAWLDKTCTRVHPTSPKDTKSGEPLH